MVDFSNNDKDVFIIKMDMIDRGALMSRYSRALNLDIRDVYKKEFADSPSHARDFYKRIFLDYGDESVAELTTAQLGIQNVSNILSKVIEEPRIGLSYLEKSSRYVRYNKKTDAGYLFLHGENTGMNNFIDEYNEHCNNLFDFYSKSYPEMLKIFAEKYPVESFEFEIGGKNYKYKDIGNIDDKTVEKSYKSSLRSAVLDEIRSVLPASTLTNIGMSGNGRAFISLIERLKAYGTTESLRYSELLYNELEKELPDLIDDSVSEHGRMQIEYNNKRENSWNLNQHLSSDLPDVSLLNYMDEKTALLQAAWLAGYGNSGDFHSMELGSQQARELINQLAGIRKNRRHKLGRAFESINYLFQINTNYGAFRELQRHRFLSIIRRDLTTAYGYDIPENIKSIDSIKMEYISLMEDAKSIYSKISKDSGARIAQYAVPYAYRYPVAFNVNLNELAYFIELRSNQQVHPDLRRVAIGMYCKVRKVHPLLSELIKFVDTGDYKLGRLPSEIRKEKKKKSINGTD
ncbi:MAG: FAD-dependent thymidylate synthase [Ferroplasma sp.]